MRSAAVVGAGIVGLATARELLRRRPGMRLVVLEKEPTVGAHQTAHNSGVVHSGVYYTPGSLRARTCVRGAAMLAEYAGEHGIEMVRRGKVIVAVEEWELARLAALQRRAAANGVPAALVGPEQLREIEPHAAGVAALHVPSTAVIDFGAVARAMARDIRELGGEVRVGVMVSEVRRRGSAVQLLTTDGPVTADTAVLCAGLHSDRLARTAGAPLYPRVVPFRGRWWALHRSRDRLVRGLVYPVPHPALPFLGVHASRGVDGTVHIGPNAVLALGREAYRRGEWRAGDIAEMTRSAGFWLLLVRHARAGAAELARDRSPRLLERWLRRYLPELSAGDLGEPRSGVRAQAVSRDGRLVDDFVVWGADGLLAVRNAPSPAATASLAIAELIADRLETN